MRLTVGLLPAGVPSQKEGESGVYKNQNACYFVKALSGDLGGQVWGRVFSWFVL
jgi:hypothetical protein